MVVLGLQRLVGAADEHAQLAQKQAARVVDLRAPADVLTVDVRRDAGVRPYVEELSVHEADVLVAEG